MDPDVASSNGPQVTQVAPPSPQPGFGPATAPPPPPPKAGFPKTFLIIGLVILILAAVGFAAVRLIPMFTKGKEVALTWWGLWEDASVVGPLIAEYEAANPNVKITYINQSKEDYRERLTNSLARGEGPDIFRFHNSWVPMFVRELDYMPASVASAAEYSQAFYPVAISDLTSGTGIVGIPLEYDGLVLFANEGMLAEVGKAAPTTWDDLRETALALTQKDEQGTLNRAGVALGRTENVDHWPEILALMMLQNQVDLAKPTGKLAEDALTFYTVFSEADGVWDSSLPTSTIAFAAGKVAMIFGPSWRAFEIKQQNPNLRFKAYAVPQLPKASPGEADVAYASYWVEGVWSRSANKVQAWDFLKFISSRDSLEKMYKNAAATRLFGEPYPRVEMANLVAADPVVGAVVSQAPNAQSWYLASRTFDGATGINSQLVKYFENAVNAVNAGVDATKALETAANGVSQVLSQYGIVTR